MARNHSLHDVRPEDVSRGFRAAYKYYAKEFPLYGKEAGLDPERWWTLVIEKTFAEAGCAEGDLQTSLPLLAPALLKHFSTKKAYRLSDGAQTFLSHLESLENAPILAAVSNTDPSIKDTLKDLGVVPRYIKEEHVVTSWDVGYQKPDSRMVEAALQRVGSDAIQASETLFIGDDYVQDYQMATKAGMKACLLVSGDEPQNPNHQVAPDGANVITVQSLDQVVPLLT